MGCLGSSKVISANEVKFLSESYKILLILSHNNYKISFANKFIVTKLVEKIPYIKLNHYFFFIIYYLFYYLLEIN